MPRRKPRAVEQELEPPMQMLPPVRTASKHPHDIDPYEAPAGAVPMTTIRTVPKEPMTATDIEQRDNAQADQKERADRYLRYLDALPRLRGDQVAALAEVFGCSLDDAKANRAVLQHEVRQGLASTSLADIIESNDVGQAARVSMLRQHVYSDVPAASLKAIDMLNEIEGNRGEVGSFESFLRIVKARKAS